MLHRDCRFRCGRATTPRWLIPALFALVSYWLATLPPYSAFIEVAPGVHQHIDAATVKLVMEGDAARFSLTFLAGSAPVSVPKRAPIPMVTCRGEPGHRSRLKHAAQLP